jgi:hypothetical protein
VVASETAETRDSGEVAGARVVDHGSVGEDGGVSKGARPMRDMKPFGIFCSLCWEEASSRSELLLHVADLHPNVVDIKDTELDALRVPASVSIGEWGLACVLVA